MKSYKIKVTIRGGEDHAEEGVHGYGNFPETIGYLSHCAYKGHESKYFYIRNDNEATPAHVFNNNDKLSDVIENIDEVNPMIDVRSIEIVPCV